LKSVKFEPKTLNTSQHFATGWPQRTQHVAPNTISKQHKSGPLITKKRVQANSTDMRGTLKFFL